MNMMDGFHREQEGRKLSFIYFKALNIMNFSVKIVSHKINYSELKTLEWNILNPDRLINLEINNKSRICII